MLKVLRMGGMLLLASLLVVGCQKGEKVTGNGAKETVTRNVAAFKNIELAGNYQVVLVGEMAQNVALTADSNLLQYVITDVQDNTLRVRTANNVKLVSSEPPLLEVFVPSLTNIDVSGTSQLNITKMDSDDLSINVSGSGKVNISGYAKKVDINVSGSGEVNAQDLTAEQVTISVNGAGKASVNPQTSIDVKVSGSGLVEYYGSPKKVTQSLNGSGRVIGISSNVQKNSN